MAGENQGQIESYLADHPRMTGALLTLLMLLSQAGTVIADQQCAACSGP